MIEASGTITYENYQSVAVNLLNALNSKISNDTDLSDISNIQERIQELHDFQNKLDEVKLSESVEQVSYIIGDFTDNILPLVNTVLDTHASGGYNGKDGQDGATGSSLTWDMLTPEQKDSLKLTFDDLTTEQKVELKGEKGASGSSLTWDMLTPEQKDSLKLTFDDLTTDQKQELKGQDGATGSSLTWDMLSSEQKDSLKLTFDDLTTEQKEELKGASGTSLTYNMLTLPQKEELKGQDGKSAYQSAVDNGFVGTEQEWIDSLNPSNLSDTGWQDLKPFLVNDWVEYNSHNNIAYRKIGSIVYFKGLVSGGTDNEIFSGLPESIRPSFPFFLSTLSLNSGSNNNVYIGESGSFQVDGYSTFWTSVFCTYAVN